MTPDSSHLGLKYRPEIDGLRAIAVIPVILFHAGFSGFRGGFVGVDVFFVISGYLISSIIVGDCENDRFSIATFYERRARRILPALFVVIAACLPFACTWMLPVQTWEFSRSMLATLAFVPNFYFWSTAQYFARASDEIPLLHMWSLGVEEQFYVVFPLLVFVLWRKGLRVLVVATVALGLLSFGASELAWRSGKLSSNFFFPITRGWELMAGALLAFVWRKRPLYQSWTRAMCNLLSLAGAALLAFSVVAFDSYTPMPSVYALAPVAGTALIIASARSDTWLHRILAHPVAVGVGLISYSAYLWHQPLFAFARIRSAAEPDWYVFLVLIGFTFLLAYLTWRFVETPFRKPSRVPRPRLITASIGVMTCLAVLGLISERTQGLAFRMAPSDVALARMVDVAAQGDYVNKRFFTLDKDFSAGSAGAVKMLVVGDSYAQDFVNAVAESGRFGEAIELRTFYVSPTCQIYFGPEDVGEFLNPQDRPSCARTRDPGRLRQRMAEANVVVLASSWQQWAIDRLPSTIGRLQLGQQQKLVIVGPKHVGFINIRELLKLPEHARLDVTQSAGSVVRATEKLVRQTVQPPAIFLSMQDAVCGESEQCKLFTPDGSLISFDGSHLTPAGARFAGERLFTASVIAAITSR